MAHKTIALTTELGGPLKLNFLDAKQDLKQFQIPRPARPVRPRAPPRAGALGGAQGARVSEFEIVSSLVLRQGNLISKDHLAQWLERWSYEP